MAPFDKPNVSNNFRINMNDDIHAPKRNDTSDLLKQHHSTIIFKGFLRYLTPRHNREFLSKKILECTGLPIEYFESDCPVRARVTQFGV